MAGRFEHETFGREPPGGAVSTPAGSQAAKRGGGLAGNAWWQWGSQGDLGVGRLLPNGVFDCTFYGCFYAYDLDPGWEWSTATVLDGGRPLLVGSRNGEWALVRLTNALVFRDGFETGDARAW